MATVRNSIDKILRAATTRTTNLAGARVLLDSSTNSFHINAAGANDPASITFTAGLIDLEGEITLTATGGTLTDVTANSAALTYANMSAEGAAVTASVTSNGQVYSATRYISKMRDGANGSKGVDGPRGAGHYYVAGGSWSDIVADMATPGENVLDDVVTISSGTFVMEKRWNGSAWVDNGVVINGKLIVPESILAGAIDTRDLKIRAPDGTILLSAGGLHPDYAAEGTKNSEQTLAGIGYNGDPNATSDLALTRSDSIKLEGNAATKTTNVFEWDSQIASVDSYVGGAFVSARVWAGSVMIGLNTDPNTNSSHETLDHALFPEGVAGGNLYYWRNGSGGVIGTWTPGDALALLYDDSKVHYQKNGVTLHSVAESRGIRYHLDSSFYSPNAKLTNIRFGPMSSNNWASIGGAGKPQDNATVGADSSNLNVGIGGKNRISKNSLPTSDSGFITTNPFALNIDGDGSLFAGPGTTFAKYSPGASGCTYMHVFGTPAANTYLTMVHDAAGRVPVVAGKRYEFSVALSAHRCSARVIVGWHNSSGNFMSEVSGSVVDVPAEHPVNLDFPRSLLFAVAPVGAVSAQIYSRQYHNGTTNNDCYTFASQWYFDEALPTQTVGSPWSDSPTGSALETNAAQQAAAAAAAAAAAKLNKNAADILAGPIALQANGAIIAGTLTVDANGYRTGGYGVATTQRGTVAFNSAGVLTFQMDAATGNVYMAGQVSGIYGTFGAVSIAAGGSLGIGATGYNTDTGIWMGYSAGSPKLSVKTSGGKSFLCDPANDVLSFGGDIANQMSVSIVSSVPSSKSNNNGVSTGLGSLAATISGGNGPYTYSWVISSSRITPDGSDYAVYVSSGDETSTVSFSARVPNNTQLKWSAKLFITDARGIMTTKTVLCQTQFGTPV